MMVKLLKRITKNPSTKQSGAIIEQNNIVVFGMNSSKGYEKICDKR